MGASAGLLTYAAVSHPAYFSVMRVTPLSMVAAALAYGIYFDDKAVVGGVAAGYAAFLMAL